MDRALVTGDLLTLRLDPERSKRDRPGPSSEPDYIGRFAQNA
jgi:hypothetical protein